MLILLIITTILILIQPIIFGLYILYNKINSRNKMLIYGDAATSYKEQILFYNITNVRRFKAYWNADLKGVKIYAMGREITSVAFKTDDLPTGIRIMFSGMMNSSTETLHLIAAIKYDLWEVSFDGGESRKRLHQFHSFKDDRYARKRARAAGWGQNGKISKSLLDDYKKSEKSKHIDIKRKSGGLVSHINEGLTTTTTMRYQALFPSNHTATKLLNEDTNAINFYHVYYGKSYKLNSKFVERTGNLWEFDLIDLEPGKIYTGLSGSFDNGKSLIPLSALYGITKKIDGELPTIDEAELAKPSDANAQVAGMPVGTLVKKYLGKETSYKYYDVIVKKHFEDSHEDDFVALTRAREFYDDFEWLYGNSDSDISVSMRLVDELHITTHGKETATSDLDEE